MNALSVVKFADLKERAAERYLALRNFLRLM